MAFQLKAKESVNDGIKRNVKREIEKALDYLDAEMQPKQRKTESSEAVHEVRKSFKKVRAALRLVRDGLGDEVYHEENFHFRDAARPLTEVRDAEMLAETLEKIGHQYTDQIDAKAIAKVLDALRTNHQQVAHRVLNNNRVFVAVKAAALQALERLSNIKIDHDGWEAVGAGLKRVYQTGHRALRLAAENPSVANLHEWRKQAKYLWHLLQLLETSWVETEKDLGDQAHQLSRLLGEDHDLAILRQTLAADPLTYGGHGFLKNLFVLIDRSRKELEKQAFALGRKIYKDQPKIFIARIESYWNVQRDRSISPASKPRLAPSGTLKQRRAS